MVGKVEAPDKGAGKAKPIPPPPPIEQHSTMGEQVQRFHQEQAKEEAKTAQLEKRVEDQEQNFQKMRTASLETASKEAEEAERDMS